VSLRRRFALGLAVITAGAIGVGGTAAYVSTSEQLHDDVDAFLTEHAEGFRDSSLPVLMELLEEGEEVVPALSQHQSPFYSLDSLIQIVGKDGQIMFSIPEQPSLPIETADREIAAGETREGVFRDVPIGGTDYRMLTTALPSGGALQTARDLTETTSVLAQFRNRLLVIGLLSTLAAAGVGWLFARRMARPVEDLTDTAETIAATKNLDLPIPVEGRDEVGRLASSFETMLAALRISQEQQRRLVVDAGHELRTPVTSLYTNIELLHKGAEMDETSRRNLLDDLLTEMGGLSDLVEELVELATDQAAPHEPAEEIHLADLAERVCERARRRSGREVVLVTHRVELVKARRAMIERAIGNLVENAVKFGPADSPVEVVVDGTGLEVRDHGPGIPEEERDLVLERFYRPVESQSVPGSGLGLAIVKEIIDSHGGSVSVGTMEGYGSVVGFTLPYLSDGNKGEPDAAPPPP
jgi:two-component system sensor histidine kinase MprB